MTHLPGQQQFEFNDLGVPEPVTAQLAATSPRFKGRRIV